MEMDTIRITKEFHFEAAHALVGYDGKCKHIHGHSYKLFVTVIGSPLEDCASPKCGMLMDFTDLKAIVNESIIDKYDHSLIMTEGSPLSEELIKVYDNVITVPFRPTCENLIIHFAELLKGKMPENSPLFSIKLYETSSSFVEWHSSDN